MTPKVMETPLLLLQKGDPTRAPLFLIHDASGGIYNYRKLHDIGRPVYAIANPWQKDRKGKVGGMKAMVDEYVGIITGVRRRGDVMVGGKLPVHLSDDGDEWWWEVVDGRVSYQGVASAVSSPSTLPAPSRPPASV